MLSAIWRAFVCGSLYPGTEGIIVLRILCVPKREIITEIVLGQILPE